MTAGSEKFRLVWEDDLTGLPEDVPVFGTRRWLEATRKALAFPLCILKVYKGDAFLAYLPLQCVRKAGLEKAFVPILTFYGGPYFLGEPRENFNEEVKQRYEILGQVLECLENRFHYSLLLPEECDARAALERGWTCSPRYTVVNLLQSKDSLLFNRACSKNIRKAERLGLRFGPSLDGTGFEEAFARTFVRKELAMSWKPRWAADLRRELTGSGILENHSVFTPEGREIAFASVALDAFRKTAILWYSCSLAEADHNGAMHFLLYQLLLAYRDRFEVFDLCGADHRSLSEFKEKFGQRLDVRFSLEKYRGPVSKTLLQTYARVRRHAG
jgi:hypothetical protein